MPRALLAPVAALLCLLPSCARPPKAEPANRLAVDRPPATAPVAATAPAATEPVADPDAIRQALIDKLDHGTETDAAVGIYGLATLAKHDPKAMAALRRAATSDRIAVRLAAAAVLSKTPDEQTINIQALRDMLKDPDAFLKVLAAKAILDADEGKAVARAKASALGGGPNWTPEAAAKALNEASDDDALKAVQVLDIAMGRQRDRDFALAALRGGLAHKSPAVRRAAALAVRSAEPEDAGALAELLKAVRQGDLQDRVEVARSLASSKPLPVGVLGACCAALRDGAFTTKLSALRTLEGLGRAAEPAVPDVEQLLDSQGVAFQAYRTLRAIRPATAEDDALAPHIQDLAPGVSHQARIAALRALGEKGKTARPALWGLLAQADRYGPSEESAAVIGALSRVAPDDPRAFDGVVARYQLAIKTWREGEARGWGREQVQRFGTRDSLVEVTGAMAEALGRMKPPVREVGALLSLLDVFQDADTPGTQSVSAGAHSLLWALGDKALPELLRRLLSNDTGEKLRALHGVAVLAIQSPDAMTLLGDLFRSENAEVRVAALRRAAAMGPVAAPLVPKLVKAIGNTYTVEADAAIAALAAIGPDAKEALPRLRDIATTDEYRDTFRERAALAILKIAPEDPSATPVALWLLPRDRLVEVLEAAPHLREPEKLSRPIADIAARRSDPAESTAFDALIRMGPKAADAVPVLVPLLDGNDNPKRVAAARTLAAIGPAAKDAASSRLGRMTDNADPSVRRAAADALVAIDSASPYLASAYLAAVHRRDTSLVRMLAPRVRAIEGSAQRVRPKLTEIAASDPDNGVRAVAAQALKEVEGK